MSVAALYDETVTLPRAVRFPVELLVPEGFDSARLETWPQVDGRLEHVDGRLLFMPPCGELQQDTAADVAVTLGTWARAHPQFVLGTNEAGMRLGEDTRAADAALWRASDLAPQTTGLRRVPPVLAVELAGDGATETQEALRDKAAWYLNAGVAIVWLVLPLSREVVVVTSEGEARFGEADRLPDSPALPDLTPEVTNFFRQLRR